MMMKINPANLIERFSNSKLGQYFGNPAASAAVTIATASNITKDATITIAVYVFAIPKIDIIDKQLPKAIEVIAQ